MSGDFLLDESKNIGYNNSKETKNLGNSGGYQNVSNND
jgi:hypothetical protein